MGLKKFVPLLIVIFSPIIISLFTLFIFYLHARWPFLVSSLRDFSERIIPNINKGLLPYRDFPFEYPPLFYGVIFLTNLISDIYRVAGSEKLSAVHFFFLVPVMMTIYLTLVPKEYRVKTLLMILVSLPLTGASFDPIATLLVILALIFFTAGFDLLSFLTLAIASGIRVYPLVLLPLLFLRRRGLRKNLIYLGFFIFVMIVPFLFVISYGGLNGLIESFTYQLSRGIHYESIMATPHFILANLRLTPDIYFIRNLSYDISYGEIDKLIWLFGTVLFFILYLLIIIKIFREMWLQWGNDSFDRTFIFDAAYTLTLLLLIFSKLLSPQFIIWVVLLLPFTSPTIFKKSYRLILAVIALTVIETGIAFRHQQFTSLPLIFRNVLLIISTLSAWKFFKTRLARFN